MSRKKPRTDAGRPRTPSRLVYDDWVCGCHVKGYATVDKGTTFIVFVKAWSGSVLCTTRYVSEWWEFLVGTKQQEVMKSYVSKALAAKAPAGKGAAATDSTLAASCPALHEFLTLSVLPGGATRTPSTLLVFSEGGLWKAALNERDAGLVLWATAESLQGLWDELEARLTADVVDWRVSKPYGAAAASKKRVDKK